MSIILSQLKLYNYVCGSSIFILTLFPLHCLAEADEKEKHKIKEIGKRDIDSFTIVSKNLVLIWIHYNYNIYRFVILSSNFPRSVEFLMQEYQIETCDIEREKISIAHHVNCTYFVLSTLDERRLIICTHFSLHVRVFLPAVSCILSKCIRYVTGIKLLDTKVLESQRHGTNQCVRLLAVKLGMRKLRSASATERQRKLKPITIVSLWKIADRQVHYKCVEEKCHSLPLGMIGAIIAIATRAYVTEMKQIPYCGDSFVVKLENLNKRNCKV